MKILTINGLTFKDLNRNGTFGAYEEWQLPADARAKNLAANLSVAEIAGLMLYSSHQSIPARAQGYFAGTYNGKPFTAGETDPATLTDQQQKFLRDDNLRHALVTTVQSPEIAARWNNNIQAYCEGLGKGIPANNSYDPRRNVSVTGEKGSIPVAFYADRDTAFFYQPVKLSPMSQVNFAVKKSMVRFQASSAAALS